jgi:hypothetical protein
MTEDFLHYIWRSSLFYPLSTNGFRHNIEVLSAGEPNRNSGPDFLDARIRIDEMVFAGNVEIHINASDWYRHGHHHNKAYDNVILQLVLNRDAEVRRTTGEIIPTAEIRFDNKLTGVYRQLMQDEQWISCQPYIKQVNAVIIDEWLTSLAIRRLEQKSLILRDALHQNQNSWEAAFYQQLAHNFGFRLNGEIFGLLARSLPYRLILKHRNSIFQIEAMLFGQAGMLTSNKGDCYFEALKREYHFLKRKYNLTPLEKHLWKFLRLRPANFPTIRIAQFSAFLHKTPYMFSTILETGDRKKLESLFKVSASEYWNTHYVFNKESGMNVKNLGRFAIRSIIINTVVPVLYFYGQQRLVNEYSERAKTLLMGLPGENNSVIRKWGALGIEAGNAFISQALLQQKNEFCNYRLCLNCKIGINVINRK